ncbi:hypothetical protein D0X99_03205 [Algoriphagus lacus]|uniref:LTD domain-containing protein n=1 Tax=Algoriphagus lacus TaxID=2056311 RepID=A0A418PXB1_9BACT|nr:lamin tail domain-containing protein [Algoriphagus lacus]RIW18703.1 hypothetical protein D0X99_03205 [Algoriphagus lacus]
MKIYFLSVLRVIFPVWIILLIGIETVFAQSQKFEEPFQILNYPQEFLPGWFGNEIRSTTSRIFQDSNSGRSGSKSLSVQPISTFNGVIWIKLTPAQFENPQAIFFAKSSRNGTGSRPAQVFFAWGEELDGEFSDLVQIGSDAEFANDDQDYRRFTLPVPMELIGKTEIFLRLEIRYGPGSGSAARWMMDDFEFGDIITDELPPQIQEARGFGPKSVLVSFSEPVDPVFSILPLAYELGGENPEKVELKADSVAVLMMENDLQDEKSYGITVRQIPDLEGNFLQDTTIQFSFYDPTEIPEKTLVLNELMPAPRADQDLPNVEYIEIYHAGDDEVRLEGIRLSNSRSETILDDLWLKPGEYLVLAPENQAVLLRQYGKVFPVREWPTLLNSGDHLTLKAVGGSLIDQISYSTASWRESEFANGGFSLEVPNSDYQCDNSVLLMPSIDSVRGTPGKQNSVRKGNEVTPLPVLENAWFQDSLTVNLTFSEPVFSRIEKKNIVFSPSLEIDSTYFSAGDRLVIYLKSPAKESEIYRLEISGIKDCWGNDLDKVGISKLILSSRPQPGDVILNEVLFDPKSGDPKFVELRNTSKKFLNLDSWALANFDDFGKPDQIREFGKEGLILNPEGYLAISTDINRLKLSYPKSASGNLLQIPLLPSYPISGGTVVLISPEGKIFETFTYNEDFHHPLLRDSKGVSLERISHFSEASLPSNWQSASGNEDFGTPGRKNSQIIEGDLNGNMIQIEPEVFDPEGSSGPAFASIQYQLDQTGWVGTFQIYSVGGQLIQTLAQNQVLGTSGIFTWTGTDSAGNRVRMGYYVLVVELYEPSGRTNLIKKTIVVADRL